LIGLKINPSKMDLNDSGGSNLTQKLHSAASSKRRRGLEHVDVEVGANLREYRIRAGLSQEALGVKIGVTFQQVQKYEKGTNAIATARLPAICEALNISPNDLYGSLYKKGKPREPAPQMSSFAVKLALTIDGLSRAKRVAIAGFFAALTGEEISE
jgi:transcriptional regulator with XRE-family HTH domain